MSAASTNPPASKASPLWRAIFWPFRRWRWLSIAPTYFAFCWLFIAAATPTPGRVNLPELPSGTHRVWVVGYGYHTAIFIQQPAGWKLGPPGFEEAPFVEFGWGDKGWFMDSDMSVPSGLNALFAPSKSVYYVAGYDKPPHEAWPGLPLRWRDFSADELSSLAHSLEQSALRSSDGSRPEAYAQTSDYAGRFYPGREYYICWHSCNHWTIETLRRAGQRVSELGVVTQDQAFSRLTGWIAPNAHSQ